MTLIEVLGGLALLGSVFAAILIAHGRLTQQYDRARRQQQAIAAADWLLLRWHEADIRLTRPDSGQFTNQAGLRWQRRLLPATPKLEKLGARKVRVTVSDEQVERERPLLSVTLLAPELDDAPAGGEQSGSGQETGNG